MIPETEGEVLLEDPCAMLPEDAAEAVLIARVWMPARDGRPAGPGVARVTPEVVHDLTGVVPSAAELLNARDPLAIAGETAGTPVIGELAEVAANTLGGHTDPDSPRFLAPVDLQPVKACGVTFFGSLIERLIEERSTGEKDTGSELREAIAAELGSSIENVRPATPEALHLREVLKSRGVWSPYLEVALGEDAEIFTKALPLSCVGPGAGVGILPHSRWNNPEPEVTLLMNAGARIVGVTLGNDVNHRDIEGRSALLLGRAKDNNGGCALGPFVRLLDAGFTLDTVRGLEVSLEIEGEDGFRLRDGDSMRNIRRDVLDITRQCIGPLNAFPDGVALMLGAMASPTRDRGEPGMGFTHHPGDVVRISSPRLGTLVNRVTYCDRIPAPIGMGALMRNLHARGCLDGRRGA